MVISYYQNLQFKIQCRKIVRQSYNLIHYIFYILENSHNNMDMEITTKVCTFWLYY